MAAATLRRFVGCSIFQPSSLSASGLRGSRCLATSARLCNDIDDAGNGTPPAPSAHELDEKAARYYHSHPCSHYSLSLDRIEFRVGSNFVTGAPHPHVAVIMEDGTDMAPTSGILNVTPFSKTMFSWFGKTGNVGKESRFEKTPSGMIEDPLAANQEINLFPDGVRSDIGRNIALLDYFDWLGALREKYIDHLTDNMESYPPLVKHYGFLLKGADTDRDTVRQVISQLTTDEIKYRKDDEGLPDPDTAFLPMKQKLYFRTQDKGGRKSIIRCDLDEEMREHGYQRRHVPLYDLNGVEIPLENVNLARGDIISVESNITCALYEVGGKPGARLRRNIRSVVRLRHDMDAEISDSAESPFKF